MATLAGRLTLRDDYTAKLRRASKQTGVFNKAVGATSKGLGALQSVLSRASSSTNTYSNAVTSATKSTLGLNRSLGGSSLSLKNLVPALTAVAAGYLSINNAVKITQSSLKDFQRRYIAQARVLKLSQTRFGSNDISPITRQISANRKIGIASTNQQLEAAGQIGAFVNSPEKLNSLLGATLDVVAGKYGLEASTEDYITVSRAVAKAYSGETFALQRLVGLLPKSVRETLATGDASVRLETVLKMLSEAYGGMNEAIARTPFGNIRMFENRLEDLRVEIGALLLPVVEQLYDTLIGNFDLIEKAAGKFATAVRASIHVAVKALQFFIKNFETVRKIVLGVVIAIGSAIAVFVAIKLAITAASIALAVLQLAVSSLGLGMIALVGAISSAVIGFGALTAAAGTVVGALYNIYNGIKTLGNASEDEWARMSESLTDVGIDIYNLLAGLLNNFLDFVTKTVNFMIRSLNRFIDEAVKFAADFQNIWNESIAPLLEAGLSAMSGIIGGYASLAGSGFGHYALGIKDKTESYNVVEGKEYAREYLQNAFNQALQKIPQNQRRNFSIDDFGQISGPKSSTLDYLRSQYKELVMGRAQYTSATGSFLGNLAGNAGILQAIEPIDPNDLSKGYEYVFLEEKTTKASAQANALAEALSATSSRLSAASSNLKLNGNPLAGVASAIGDRRLQEIPGAPQIPLVGDDQRAGLKNQGGLFGRRLHGWFNNYRNMWNSASSRAGFSTQLPENDPSLASSLLNTAEDQARDAKKTAKNTEKISKQFERFFDLEGELAVIRSTNNFTSLAPNFKFSSTGNQPNNIDKDTYIRMVNKELERVFTERIATSNGR